ncbi:hypothetical protein [Vreelandella titanicae]
MAWSPVISAFVVVGCAVSPCIVMLCIGDAACRFLTGKESS